MKVKVINEAGHMAALIGMALSYGTAPYRIYSVAETLAVKDGGHNKFLESMMVWMDISAPRYWWQQFDTYRVGITKQSESTMHTLMKTQLTKASFEHEISQEYIDMLNGFIGEGNLDYVKNILPEGFIQRRIVLVSYKGLRNIFQQRLRHKLKEWQYFCNETISQLEFPSYFRDIIETNIVKDEANN